MQTNFECNMCYKIFKYKYLLTRHTNNKISCNIKQSKIIENIEIKIINLDTQSLNSNNICFYCNKNFKRKDSLKRHIEIYCNKRKTLIDTKNKILNNNIVVKNKDENILELKKEIGELKECINQLLYHNVLLDNVYV